MKTLIILTFLILGVNSLQSQWIQTSSTPNGRGVRDMVILDDETILVSSSSFQWPTGQYGGIRRSTNRGASWQNIVDVLDGGALWVGSTGKIFAAYNPTGAVNLYVSSNSGVSFEQINNGNTVDAIFSIATKDNDNVIFLAKWNGIMRSLDGGSTWQFLSSNGIPSNTHVWDLDVHRSDGIIAAGTTKGLYVSSNNGDSWSQVSGTSQDTIFKVKFDYALQTLDNSEDRLLAGSRNGSLYEAIESDDYLMATLLAIFDNEVSSIWIYYLKNQNKKVHGVSTFQGGFHTSTNNGNSWQTKNEGLPTNPPIRVSAVEKYDITTGAILIWVAMYLNSLNGAVMYYYDLSLGIQSLSNEIPERFSLSQNYPNPFNPTTKIRFDIQKHELITLKVYDILGKEVTTLVNESLQPGSYEASFDAAGLSSGVYYYTIRANDFVATKKMLLTK